MSTQEERTAAVDQIRGQINRDHDTLQKRIIGHEVFWCNVRSAQRVLEQLDDLAAENARLCAQLSVFTQPTEWDTPHLEWTWGSCDTDEGPGRIIYWVHSEEHAREAAAMPPRRDGLRKALLCRDVSAWREVTDSP